MLRRALCDFARNSSSTEADLGVLLDGLPRRTLARLIDDWQIWARDDQLPPSDPVDAGPWRTWLFLGGRGAGKTRAGAEWIKAVVADRARWADDGGPLRLALVGETLHDVRAVMVEGVSGLLSVHRAGRRPRYEAARTRLRWPDGTVAQLFSAERPERLRGPQFHAAWCDELVKWRHAESTWDMLQFGLRLGMAPRAVVTPTPKLVPLLKRVMADAATVLTRATTLDNKAHLAAPFIAEIQRRYAGTALGRQELEGEVIDDVAGALWRRDWFTSARVSAPPPLGRICVGVDPPVTSHAGSDACGIVVAGLGPDARAYVLADRTVQGRTPDVWARAAVAAVDDFGADVLVAEVNQGGDLVESVIRQVAPNLPVRKVRAKRGKWLRAEPVASLYAEGRVVHVGEHAALEAQMLSFGVDGAGGRRSPDRVDALVWALTELMLTQRATPTVRRV